MEAFFLTDQRYNLFLTKCFFKQLIIDCITQNIPNYYFSMYCKMNCFANNSVTISLIDWCVMGCISILISIEYMKLPKWIQLQNHALSNPIVMLNKSDLKSLQILSWMSEYFEIRTCWPKMNNDKLITPKYWYYILLIATKNCTLKNHKSFGNIVWCYISPNMFYKWVSITMGIIDIHDEEKIWIFKKNIHHSSS